MNMNKYLEAAGKSIKLTLSSDLLLTNEYIYSNQVKVNLKLSNDGTIQNASVVSSSGSNQVDKIVLQTVKDTLNVVKPVRGEVPTQTFNLGLIIYL
jgi:TonB family protein